MTGVSLERAAIREGRWTGELRGDAQGGAPSIAVLHLGEPLDGVAVTPLRPGVWQVSAPLPPALLSDGVQSFVVRDEAAAATIGHFAIAVGVALEDDIRAEIELLRAELDMLKRAFRRHCLETGG